MTPQHHLFSILAIAVRAVVDTVGEQHFGLVVTPDALARELIKSVQGASGVRIRHTLTVHDSLTGILEESGVELEFQVVCEPAAVAGLLSLDRLLAEPERSVVAA